MNKVFTSTCMSIWLLFTVGAHAQTQTSPSNSTTTVTATCKDGSTFSGPSKRGACSQHGGVKAWGAGEAAAASTPGGNTRAVPAATNAPAKPGGGPGQVWVNTASKVYHCEGDRYYGKTKQGEYMSEQAAKASGSHPADGKACS
jgi:hypothetical protein